MATPVLMPRLGQSVESCILAAWLVKEGDTVTAGQPLARYETDKASFEIESPAAGRVLALFFGEGDDIPVLTHIAAIGAPGESFDDLRPGTTATPPANPAESGAAASPAPAVSTPAQGSAPIGASSAVSPRARQAASKHGVDPSQLAGTGPGGRVIERDVQAALRDAPRVSAAALATGKGVGVGGTGLAGMVRSGDTVATATPAASDRVIPVKGIRKIIAERMRNSLGSTAQLTMTMSFDLTAVQSARAHAKKAGRKVTINDLISHAAVQTLRQHADLNAHFLGDRVVQYGAVHLGMAVDTPRGLMVPVIHHADRMDLAGLAAAIRERADACQSGAVNPDLLQGGTFTLTNLGSLGVETFTPVLNAPEVAILGVGGIQWRHLHRDGRIQLVESITLSLTVDHQVVDGAPAARFLKDLCETLEHIQLDPA